MSVLLPDSGGLKTTKVSPRNFFLASRNTL